MQSNNLGLQKILVLLGFLLVSAGQIPPIGFPSLISQSSEDFYWIVTAIGYALFGCASWAWVGGLSKNTERGAGMRWVLRLVAFACLVLGIAYAGLINEVIELHRQVHHVGLRRMGLSYLLPLLGFCVAAVGFWTAACFVDSWIRPPRSHSLN
ncbi:MAG: hypothetical protein ACRD6W_13670 [Nitrososphaerales archaeon]